MLRNRAVTTTTLVREEAQEDKGGEAGQEKIRERQKRSHTDNDGNVVAHALSHLIQRKKTKRSDVGPVAIESLIVRDGRPVHHQGASTGATDEHRLASEIVPPLGVVHHLTPTPTHWKPSSALCPLQ